MPAHLLAQANPVAQTKGPAPKRAPAASVASRAASPKIEVVVASLFDRRTNSDFPGPSLNVTLTLQGEDARLIQSARVRIVRAVDDTGRDLVPAPGTFMFSGDTWQHARNQDPPQPRVELASPSRKAKTLTAVEGVLETFMPLRDPESTVKIDDVLAKRDQPLSVAALNRQGVKLRILSKAALEKEKEQAEAKKKARAEKAEKSEKAGKPGKSGGAGGKKDALEEVTEKMTEALVDTLGRLFMFTGENDLVIKVEDPGKKVFSFDVTARDGSPVPSYGTTPVDDYRIMRVSQPIPPGSSLQVRLKTVKASGETPFTLAGVPLP